MRNQRTIRYRGSSLSSNNSSNYLQFSPNFNFLNLSNNNSPYRSYSSRSNSPSFSHYSDNSSISSLSSSNEPCRSCSPVQFQLQGPQIYSLSFQRESRTTEFLQIPDNQQGWNLINLDQLPDQPWEPLAYQELASIEPAELPNLLERLDNHIEREVQESSPTTFTRTSTEDHRFCTGCILPCVSPILRFCQGCLLQCPRHQLSYQLNPTVLPALTRLEWLVPTSPSASRAGQDQDLPLDLTNKPTSQIEYQDSTRSAH